MEPTEMVTLPLEYVRELTDWMLGHDKTKAADELADLMEECNP
jgi:hypothetical protein